MSPLKGLVRRLVDRLGAARNVEDARWVVLDVEATGLDARTDCLLAIAALAVRFEGRPRIVLGDSFEAVLRRDVGVPDKANILLHGIGVGAQRQGVEPARALSDFESYIGNSPLVAFNAPFDKGLILRAFDAALGRRPANPWLDLEPLAGVLHPQAKARALDEWMELLHITCAVRHQAAADVLATAELLLKLWPVALREMGGKPGFAAAHRLAEHRRWVPR